MLGRVVKNDIRDQSGRSSSKALSSQPTIRIAEAAGVIIDLTLEL